MPQRVAADLLKLAHDLGNPACHFAMHGEGDVSARVDARTFFIKAANKDLAAVSAEDFSLVSFAPLIELVAKKPNANAAAIHECLRAATRPGDPPPSREAFFHAVLLDLPHMGFVGHTHPTYVNAIMASPKALPFAHMRLFPSHVQFCGARSLFVPYMDPGLRLAVELRERLIQFIDEYGTPPGTILLANHGMIAVAPTPDRVLSATSIMQKAATVYLMAQSCGGAVPMPDADVARVARDAGLAR